MSKMATESESMAKVMGMSIEDYTKAFTDDANETMLRLFETLKGGGEANASFVELVNLLGETDLEGQRMTQVMGTMVNHVDEIRKQMELSNKAFAENTSIVQEFNVKNNNAQAILEKKQKAIKALRVELGEKLMPVYIETLGIYEKFIYGTSTVIQFLMKHAAAIIALVAAILTYRTALFIITSLQKASIIYTGISRVVVLALSVAYNRLTLNTVRAAAATKLLSLALKTTPWGIVASALTGLLVAMFAYLSLKKKTIELESSAKKVEDQVADQYGEKAGKIQLLVRAIENENLVLSYRKAAIQELKGVVTEYHGWLDEEGKLINHNKESIDKYLVSFKQQIRAQALKDEYASLYTQEYKTGKELSELLLQRQQLEDELNASDAKPALKDSMRKTIFVDIDKKINELKEKYNKIVSELRGVEIDINKGLVKQIINGTAIEPTEGGTTTTPADYSENAELEAQTAAYRKYQKGIIKSEIDLQTELDKIALRFMRGRLSQLDKDSEDRAKLQLEIVKKEIEIEKNKQKILEDLYATGVDLSPVQKLDLEFTQNLEKLNITDVTKLTEEQAYAYKTLKQKHQLELDKLDAEAIKDEVERKQNAFDVNLSNLKLEHIRELDQVTTYEQAMEMLRKKYTDEELKDIKTLNDAKLKLQADQQKEESDLAIVHIEELLAQMQSLATAGTLDGVSFTDSVFSEEELKAWQEIITKLIDELDKLKKAKKEATGESETGAKDPGVKLRGRFRTDILGFTTEDWETLFDDLDKYEDKIAEIADRVGMAAYAMAAAWTDANTIIKNREDSAMLDYERKVDDRKELLADQLEKGLINQEYYNKQVEALDKDLDYKKAVLARKQAIRDRNVAIFSAIVNTAVAITKVLDKPWLIALVALAGALQLATIVSTPLPQVSGKEKGGYFDVEREQDHRKFRAKHDPYKRGWINQPTILAGEADREYVIPGEAMDNPSIRQLVDMLEMARISHNLKTVDLARALPSIPGRATGGFIYQQTPTSPAPSGRGKGQGSSSQTDFNKLVSSIDMLNQILSTGNIQAKLIYQDLTEMEDKVQKIENDSSF